jgi:hypothetical protein
MAKIRLYGLQMTQGYSIVMLSDLTYSTRRAVALKIIAACCGTSGLDNLLKLNAIAPGHPGHRHLLN